MSGFSKLVGIEGITVVLSASGLVFFVSLVYVAEGTVVSGDFERYVDNGPPI